jgi:hypothetical protein
VGSGVPQTACVAGLKSLSEMKLKSRIHEEHNGMRLENLIECRDCTTREVEERKTRCVLQTVDERVSICKRVQFHRTLSEKEYKRGRGAPHAGTGGLDQARDSFALPSPVVENPPARGVLPVPPAAGGSASVATNKVRVCEEVPGPATVGP